MPLEAHEPDDIDRVVATVDHARMLMFRDESIETIEHELELLAEMGDAASIEASLIAAVEILAQAPHDALGEWAERARAHRATRRRRS